MNNHFRFVLLGLILLVAFNLNNSKPIFAHTFSGDESASFLSAMEMIKIDSQLAAEEVASNITIAKDYAEHITEHITANDTKEINERNPRLATELNSTLTDFVNAFETGTPSQSEVTDKVTNISDVLSEVVSARIDQEQLDNVTVKALVVNDLVGEGLQHYGNALGIEESEHEENQEHESASNETENGSNETANIVNEADYESAKAAISRATDMYNEIKPSENTNSTELGTSLTSLKDAIDSKTSFDQIDKIVDNKITPLLNNIFELNLSEEEQHGEEGGAQAEEGEDHAEAQEESHPSSENETHEAETEG